MKVGDENVKDLQSCTHPGALIQLTETEIIVSGNESAHMELSESFCAEVKFILIR